MNQKKFILAIVALLHLDVYSMKKSNEITDKQIPEDYFHVADGRYLPRTYQNDISLENISYCYITQKYIISTNCLKEAQNCYSIFPALDTTRIHSTIWKGKGNEALYRFKKVTSADLLLLAHINKCAILKN
jgi:hypothetical protein